MQGVVAFVEAVPAAGMRGAVGRERVWSQAKSLTGAVSRASTGLTGPLFTALAFSEAGEPGEYRLRFYAEGVMHFEAEQTVLVTSRVNLVRLRLPYTLQLAYPGCDLQYYPLRDRNGDGNVDRTVPSQAICVTTNVGRRLPGTALPYVEAFICSTPEWSVASDCKPAGNRQVTVRAIAPSRLPLAYQENGTRRWPIDLGNETESDALVYSIPDTDIAGRSEIDFLMFPQAFASGWLLEFSVGGHAADERVAVSLQRIPRLGDAAAACSYTPSAQIRLLSAPDATMVYPGSVFNVTVFVVDLLGEPAKDVPVCLRIFSLDWNDPVADEVRAQADATALAKERATSPGDTLFNMTWVPPVCFVTNAAGVGTLLYRHDGRDQRYRLGPFAWYLESAEFESGEIWDLDTSGAWVLRYAYKAREHERQCFADFGFEVVPPRTDTFYTYLHSQVTFSGPFRILLTGRYPAEDVTQACAKCPEVIVVTYPEKVSYYSDLQRRIVGAGESYYIYLRVYNGTVQNDDLLFPAGLEIRSYLVGRPANLATRQCTANDPRNDTTLCYSFRDFDITSAVFTDSYGFGSFHFMAAAKYSGLFRLVFTVGSSSSGANFFTQSIEIEVVNFQSADDCSGAQGTSPKTYQRCSVRMPDTSCAWNPLNLCLATKSNLLISSGPSPGVCVSFGSKLPGPYIFSLQGDNSLPLVGYSISAQSPVNDQSLYFHTGYTPQSIENGSLIFENIFLDYADIGMHNINFSISELNSRSFSVQSVLSSPFYVADELIAIFVEDPPSVVGLHEIWLVPPTIRLRINHKCEHTTTSQLSFWTPPLLELFLIETDSNHNEGMAPAAISVGTEIHAVPSVDSTEDVALGTFQNFTIIDGEQGLYKLGVRVKGSKRILGKSSLFLLRTEAVQLSVLDMPPNVVNSDTYLCLRVIAMSERGLGLYNIPILASIRALNSKTNSTKKDATNFVFASLDDSASQGYTDKKGIAYFNLTFASYSTGNQFIVQFQSKGAFDAFSSAFVLSSPIKSIQILNGVKISSSYLTRWVWPLLKTRSVDVGLQTFVQQVPVRATPASMKGSFTGASGELSTPTLLVKDHRNRSVEGFLFNVTLIDFENNILNSVVPSSASKTIAQDPGFFQTAPSCSVNLVNYDCHGLYYFPILATLNTVQTGFYTFAFASEGLFIMDQHELMFVNIVYPDTLYKLGYMIGVACSIMCSIMLFQAIRRDSSVLQKENMKYKQVKWKRQVFALAIAGILCGCWISANVFYYQSDLDKSPPLSSLDQNGILSLDYISRYTIYTMFVSIFVCTIYSLNLDVFNKFGFNIVTESGSVEMGMKKLCKDENLEIKKRSFKGKRSRKIVLPFEFSKNSVLGKMIKATNDLVKPFEPRLKEINFHVNKWMERAVRQGADIYTRYKYSLPVLGSIHYSVSDVFFGQRYVAAILIIIIIVAALHGVGIWFSAEMYSLLTSPYSYYMSVLSQSGSSSVDWAVAVAPDRKMMHLLQLLTIFVSRVNPTGGRQAFYTDLLDDVSACIVSATIMTTVVLGFGISGSIFKARQDLCRLREGKLDFDVIRLKHIDATAYIGSQAGAIVCGWALLFTFFFSGLFFVTWGPFRDIFLGSGVMVLVIVSGVVYIMSIVFARVGVRISPGLYIHFRQRWAMKELILFVLHLGIAPFVISFRLCIGGMRNLCTWFWFHTYVYENEYIGVLGSMQYRAGLYLQHQHNNPTVRSLVERLHIQLRNKRVLRNFPMDNLEPMVIRDEIQELKDQRASRRTVSRILVMLLMRMNEAREIEKLRKNRLADKA